MSPSVCPRCHRANPTDAVYCHFDGFALQANGQGPRTSNTLPQFFVFPSGRKCSTYDELVQGCQYEWEDARDLLRAGGFQQYLSTIGRLDLARIAGEARNQLDADIALHDFIAALPALRAQGPRLDLNPRRLALGSMHVGETRQIKLLVSNGGKGLLQGKLAVPEGEGADGTWLHLIDGNDTGQCSLKAARDQTVTLLVDTRGLAAPSKYAARLTVITNGGIAEVPVSFELASIPFDRPPFEGVSSPRELAERMRAQPKPAVPLLESGDLVRWFAGNGWPYPVDAVPAKGVAAVQQFFEGMGLSKPPAVQLSPTQAQLVCLAPEVVHGQVTLATTAKKWVYAQADSLEAWLKVTTPNVSGPQQAVIGYEVDSALMDAGRVHEGKVQITANAGQKLVFHVLADVRRPQEPFTRKLLRPFLAGALLLIIVRLILAVPADLFARLLASSSSEGTGSYAFWLEAPRVEAGFAGRFVLATWWIGALMWGINLWRRETRQSDLLSGLLAGSVAGVLASATLACLWPLFDAPARWIWRLLEPIVQGKTLATSAGLWTPLWIALAGLSWAALGGFVGLILRLPGGRASRWLSRLLLPLVWTCRTMGWKQAAAYFAVN